jgi:outer membrane protein assembly factor BamE (lipoprotein component of BamABCDE complex)
MKISFISLMVVVTLFCCCAVAETPKAELAGGDVNLADVAKIKAGSSTREQITALLGAPYRMTNYADCNPIDYQEFWEYVGHDANGIFKIHIEFDDAGVARIIAKDNKKGPIVVLDAAPRPEKQHHHGSGG